jgi:proteasome accessory factor B
MEQSLPDTISLNLADLEHTISFRTRAEPILNLEIFDALAKATTQRQQLELTYRKPGSRQTEQRLVDPYHLANINGEWFLFAYDHARKDIRTFVPVRVLAVRRTGKAFERMEKFSLERRLRDSFGVHSGHGRHAVVIRFNAHAAHYIREKKWHESQQLRERKGGGVELRLKLSSLVEIERWVLSWGGDATVLKPRELAQAVKEAAEKIIRLTDRK